MPNTSNTTTCLLCSHKLVKNGRTAAGTQRWRYPNCGASSTRERPDLTRRHQLTRFLTWLTGKHSQTEPGGESAARKFRRETAWYWSLEPRIGPVTTTHPSVLVDGIWVGSCCLLIAVTRDLQVLAWQWYARESTTAWKALFEQLPAPEVVVCDGGSGIPAALREIWPATQVQRCLFHVQMNVRQHLTLKPRTLAGRRLLALSRMLSQVHTIEEAIQWQEHLDRGSRAHGHLTEERTRYVNGQSGWTHERLRKAWFLLRKLVQQETLFTYLMHGNPRTTSALEGGIKNGIRTVVRNHRGMSEEHMKRAAEWFLTFREIPASRAHELITDPNKAHVEDHAGEMIERDELSIYDTGLDATEGLWLRHGWAGRV